MPSGQKNVKYMNRHAEEARARDADRKAGERAAREQAVEDAKWANVDKETSRAEARKAEAEAKRQAQLERKAENRELYEEESRQATKAMPVKVSKRQQQKDMAKLLAAYDKEMDVARPTIDTEERTREAEAKKAAAGTKIRPEEAALDKAEAKAKKHKALDQATAEPESDDRNIGKRAKALYRKFEEDMMPEVRKEKPGMRMTQYKDMIWERWQKNPSNPFVQRAERRAADAMEVERSWMQDLEREDDDDQQS